ncbi:MAG: hypothetical protein H0T62_13970 [Parachlamydiaceae bacterium]|nr:hypothetical protein [Parachlamydiaceae bacterium]
MHTSFLSNLSTYKNCIDKLAKIKNKKTAIIDKGIKFEVLKSFTNAISVVIGPILKKFAINLAKCLEIGSCRDSILAYPLPFSQKTKEQIQLAAINTIVKLNLSSQYPKNPIWLWI